MLKGAQILLLGVEGTTTPVTFTTEKLLPYMKENAKSYLESHFDEEECQSDLDALREQASAAGKDATVIPASTEDNKGAVIDAAVDVLTNMLDTGCKSGALSQIDAHMMREAYKTGLVQGELYADVVPALRMMLDNGRKAYTLSSTSAEAQKLLFGYSDKGNVSELFSGFFDSSMGARDDKETYSKVLETVGVKADEILYLTSRPAEARAAGEAGLRTMIVTRGGCADLSEEDKKKFNIINSLTELTETTDIPEAKRVEARDDEDDDDDDVEDVDDDVVDDVDDLDGEDDGDDDAE